MQAEKVIILRKNPNTPTIQISRVDQKRADSNVVIDEVDVEVVDGDSHDDMYAKNLPWGPVLLTLHLVLLPNSYHLLTHLTGVSLPTR